MSSNPNLFGPYLWKQIHLAAHFYMNTHWQWHLVSVTKACYVAWNICVCE